MGTRLDGSRLESENAESWIEFCRVCLGCASVTRMGMAQSPHMVRVLGTNDTTLVLRFVIAYSSHIYTHIHTVSRLKYILI